MFYVLTVRLLSLIARLQIQRKSSVKPNNTNGFKKTSHYLLLLSTMFFLNACANEKVSLTGVRIPIDISTATEVQAAESRLIGGGYTLTRPNTNQEWRTLGGNAEHNPPHAAWQGTTNLAFHIKIGVGDRSYGKDTIKRGRIETIPPENSDYYKPRLRIQPIVADNKIFVSDSLYQISAYQWNHKTNDKGKIITGEMEQPYLLWRRTLPGASNLRAAHGGGLSYSPQGGSNGKTPVLLITTGYGEFFSLDAQTGDILWQISLYSPSHSPAGTTNNLAIVPTLDGAVTAFALKTGKLVWRNSPVVNEGLLSESIGIFGNAPPTINQGRVWTGHSTGNITAVNANTGAVLWQDNSLKFNIGDRNRFREVLAPLIIDSGRLYAFSYGDASVALSASNGNRSWKKQIATISQPVINNQTLFIITSGYHLAALNKATGNSFWTRPLEKYLFPGTRREDLLTWYGPLLVNNQLFLHNDRGDYLLVNALNGKKLYEGHMRVLATHVPAIVANNTLIFVNQNGYLVGLQ